jgi:RNA polymerase sigma-70 factor (ECF subfamily)
VNEVHQAQKVARIDDDRLSSLALAARQGDQSSFRALVDALTRPLIAMAYRYTRDWESAGDICQETWIKVFRGLWRYDPAQPFAPWLFTIHRNGCLNQLRQTALRREVLSVGETNLQLLPRDVADGPEQNLERGEFHDMLRRAMARLTKSQLRVFCMVDLEQMDQMAAARALRMKYATLRTTLHFARKRIARFLRDQEKNP